MSDRAGATRRRHPRWRLVAGIILLLGLSVLLAPAAYVAAATSPYRYLNAAEVPPRRVALVFGAGIRNGRPTPALAERVRGAVELYRLGRVEKLLLSGDNSSLDYDEAGAMRRYALELGVPDEDITLDYAGFSTYETCYRARDIFGVQAVVLVTQGYHLPRAVYTCRQLGLDAVGLAMPDWFTNRSQRTVRYSPAYEAFSTLREMLAILKALVDVHITHPLPTFLGPFEGIR